MPRARGPAPAPERLSGADFSPCRAWRYRLWRRWGPGSAVAFVGLNPSTADEGGDDPTIRRCLGYARDWGYDALEVVNLYGWRSTLPAPLWDGSTSDPVGPDNDRVLGAVARSADLVVAAWGAFPRARARAEAVRTLLEETGCTPMILDLTAQGWPRHPLYARRALRPVAWAALSEER